jgi:DNA-directed RNA polymerase specialized sigma subunit, sigma54 homolog
MYTKLSIRAQMKVSPQLVITSKLLQVPGSELEQFINEELANNPALELANKRDFVKEKLYLARSDGQPSMHSANFAKAGLPPLSSFEEMVENISQYQSPLEKLTEQVSIALDKTDRDIAIELLHRLDHRGFLVEPTEQLAYELGVSNETLMRMIHRLHQLEPPGIGARDIRECFLLQCTHLEAEGIDCHQVRRILVLAWSEFLNQQWDRVARKIQEPKKIVDEAREFMRNNFYPHPLALVETSVETDHVLNYADLVVLRDHHVNPAAYLLQLPGADEFELKISVNFQRMSGSEIQEHVLSGPEKTWIKMHLDRASIMISALRQRWETLRQIGEYLIQCQSNFLEHGPLYLKPLTRAVVARELNLHESTISRAVHNKVIQLPNGRLMPLSDFFDSSLAAKEAIRLLLRDATTHPCDREIAESLQVKGMSLSRRTVTKYRREINIHSSQPQSIGI